LLGISFKSSRLQLSRCAMLAFLFCHLDGTRSEECYNCILVSLPNTSGFQAISYRNIETVCFISVFEAELLLAQPGPWVSKSEPGGRPNHNKDLPRHLSSYSH
jgi:hypothetical protein